MGYETRDDCGNKMNEKQTLDYLVKGQRIQLQFLGHIQNIVLEIMKAQPGMTPDQISAIQKITADLNQSVTDVDTAVKSQSKEI